MLPAARFRGLATIRSGACRAGFQSWQTGAPSSTRATPREACAGGAPFSTAAPTDEGQKLHHQDGAGITEDELRERKTRAVRAWMEANVGPEKMRVAQILKDHQVLVRGGAEQGQKLMDALLEWKSESAASKRR